MVRLWKNAMRHRGGRSHKDFLARLEGELDSIYDLIAQIFADERTCVEVLQGALRKAMRRRNERYVRYSHLWIFRIVAEGIQRRYPRFLSECLEGQLVPFERLSLEEKLCAFLRDRCDMSIEEIAAVLQLPLSRVGRSLTYGREKVASELDCLPAGSSMTLLEREVMNRNLSVAADAPTAAPEYVRAMIQARDHLAKLPARRLADSAVRAEKILPLLTKPESLRWQDLSWQYKLGIEAGALALVGLLAVIVLPWAFASINADALFAGRFGEVFTAKVEAPVDSDLEEISTDRLLASKEKEGQGEGAAEATEPAEPDEFADVDFPSGDAYELGSAPLAPSKQSAAVYRLIVQSPSPRDLIPKVRSLFAEKNVKERDSSGRAMPGGVYFDGITTIGSYPLLLKEIEKLGSTKTYSNLGQKRSPEERARVIVWVQQI